MPTTTITPGTGVTVNLPPPDGRAAASASRPVALSTEDKAVLDLIATAANQASGNASLTTIATNSGTQATAANQAAQTTLIGPVTETAPASDTASSGLNGRMQRIAQNLTTLITFFNTLIGTLTETAPASDTASSGLNGRLQRIAQRVSSLIALVPTSLGQKASAASLAVVVASDQTPIAAKTLLAQGVSRALTTTGTTANTTLTVGIKALTIYSRGSDAYFQIGTGTQTATTSSMFIAAGERLDLDVSGLANPAIAILQGPSATATVLQLTELS